MRKSPILLLLLLLFSTAAMGQDLVVPADVEVFNAPSYLIVVLSGVLLAFGFQFFLTVFSVAVGITTIGDLKEAYVESKYRNLGKEFEDDEDDDDDRSSVPTGVKVTSGIGVWNTITVTLSLFGATFLALQMIPITTEITKVSLALVIWATFFMLVFYLESRMIGAIVGGLVSTAVAGLKASGSAISSMFTSSPTAQAKAITDNAIEKMRTEFSAEFDTEGVLNSIKKYIDKQTKEMPTYEQIRKDIKDIAVTAAKKGSKSGNPARWMALQTLINAAITELGDNETEAGQQKISELKQLLADIKDAYNRGDDIQESIKNVLELTPADEEKVDAKIDELKRQFRESDASSMSLENIQRSINQLLDDPKAEISHLLGKMRTWDRQTIIDMLDDNTSLERAQLETYADRIQSAVHMASERLGITNNDPEINNLLTSLENRVQHFIDTAHAPGLRYALLKNDVKRAINDPSQSMTIVRNRVNTFDRETFKALLANTPWISRADIDNLALTVEEARDEVKHQLEKVSSKITSTLNNAERKAVIQAEHLRQTASAAAWWTVAMIVVSAGAAVAAGLLAIV